MNSLPSVLEQQWHSAEFLPYKSAFPSEAQASSAALLEHVRRLSASDVKDPALKKLQGFLWRTGYEGGFIVTPLFPDVSPRLKQWKDEGLRLAIFSSGSVEAQKLFSKFVGVKEGEAGGRKTEDLNPLFEANYDTVNAGPKMEKESYELIAKEMGLEVGEILFLSDNVKEIQAAKKAGMQALLVDRPGNAPLTQEDLKTHTLVKSLDEVKIVPNIADVLMKP
ncbi:2-3-diketo-5-methylthio-1-phosphopentane phosphatase [Venturia nashicola]|uniref:2-3-diketo-5-methylthio-1-phosphopentane phosphatase n=1 Tax=Venturia nashicola TaxID=86259 RepID=A0A4Z1PCH7_9PEZI|nr:2-3-diketo-5-methylthio-1-phosphopentane phosphatase [Venturia nashicola]